MLVKAEPDEADMEAELLGVEKMKAGEVEVEALALAVVDTAESVDMAEVVDIVEAVDLAEAMDMVEPAEVVDSVASNDSASRKPWGGIMTGYSLWTKWRLAL